MGSSVPSSSAMAMEEKNAAKASVPRAGRGSAPEKRRRYHEQHKAYREQNRERIKEYHRKYRVANKDKIAAYLEQNRERVKEYQRKYRAANKDRIAEARKEDRTRMRRQATPSPPRTDAPATTGQEAKPYQGGDRGRTEVDKLIEAGVSIASVDAPGEKRRTVYYPHLKLPTICSV